MAEKDSKKRVTLKFADHDAKEVLVAGSFNSWDPSSRPLKKDAKGVWKTSMMLQKGVYEYRFVIDGQWVEDPTACEQRPNEFGGHNSVLVV